MSKEDGEADDGISKDGLVKKTGDERCEWCELRKEECWVNEELLATWRMDAEGGKVFSRAPAAAGCTGCRTIKKVCKLPATADLRSWIDEVTASNKRKREEASGSGATAAEAPRVKRQRSGTVAVDETGAAGDRAGFKEVAPEDRISRVEEQVMGALWELADRSADAVDFLGRIADSLERIADHVDADGSNFVQKVLRPSREPEEEFENGEILPQELAELQPPATAEELESLTLALRSMPEEEEEETDESSEDTGSEAMMED